MCLEYEVNLISQVSVYWYVILSIAHYLLFQRSEMLFKKMQ